MIGFSSIVRVALLGLVGLAAPPGEYPRDVRDILHELVPDDRFVIEEEHPLHVTQFGELDVLDGEQRIRFARSLHEHYTPGAYLRGPHETRVLRTGDLPTVIARRLVSRFSLGIGEDESEPGEIVAILLGAASEARCVELEELFDALLAMESPTRDLVPRAADEIVAVLRELEDAVSTRFEALAEYSLDEVLERASRLTGAVAVVSPSELSVHSDRHAADGAAFSRTRMDYVLRRLGLELDVFPGAREPAFLVRGGYALRTGMLHVLCTRVDVVSVDHVEDSRDDEIAPLVAVVDRSLGSWHWVARVGAALSELLTVEGVSLTPVEGRGTVLMGEPSSVRRVRRLLAACFDAQDADDAVVATREYLRSLSRVLP